MSEELIVCDDGCTQPLSYFKNQDGKYEMIRREILGFGSCGDIAEKVGTYDDIKVFNDLYGPAYIMVKKHGSWGMYKYSHSEEESNPVVRKYAGRFLYLKEDFKFGTCDELEKLYVRTKDIHNNIHVKEGSGWTKAFSEACKLPDIVDRTRETRGLRMDIFETTKYAIRWNKYTAEDGSSVSIENPKKSICYNKEINIPACTSNHDTEISVVNEDCLKTAAKLKDEHPLVLNMASRRNPGGGVENGAGAQEECLFRSSNYSLTMYALRKCYPLDRDFGGIYSADVTVFRGLEEDGYPFLKEPFKVNFVAVPALNRPNLVNGQYNDAERKGMLNKIRTILNIAAVNNQEVLVLSAFGCGAFKNPPEIVARMFKDELMSSKYKGRFKKVVFAIKSDHNDRSGNYECFKRVFEQ